MQKVYRSSDRFFSQLRVESYNRSRTMQILNDGGYVIDDRLEIPGEGSSYFVFARGWLLEIIELEAGDFYFFSDGQEVRPTSPRFGVFYPSFTIVQPFVRSAMGHVRGIGSVEDDPSLPSQPILFETDFAGAFSSVGQAAEVIRDSSNRLSIELRTSKSLLSIKAKRLIDANFLAAPMISRVAAKLGVSSEHLSRQFKRDIGLSPSKYLHQLRVAEATFRLSVGEPIIDISQDVGYNDLSRFYKQFRKNTNTSPAACRDQLAK